MTTLTFQVFCHYGWGWATLVNWSNWASVSLCICLHAVFRGDGILVLARRSDTSAPGYAVLLDQDFTVTLNGSQSVVEAITESSFSLSQPNIMLTLPPEEDSHGPYLPYQLLEALCEGVYLIIPASCWLLLVPSATLGSRAAMVAVFCIATFLQISILPGDVNSLKEILDVLKQYLSRLFPGLVFLLAYERAKIEGSLLDLHWYKHAYFLSLFLFFLFLDRYRGQSYPIRSEKLLDALGNPRVRTWQFDTLAAAATFQCLVLCCGITRPIRCIDILAYLDMLVPDERDVWKARVADRIMHEEDIDFTPTIPTFGDARQRHLKDLLDQGSVRERYV